MSTEFMLTSVSEPRLPPGNNQDTHDSFKVVLSEYACLGLLLHPIRSGLAETPEESDYTWIQQWVLERDPKIAARDQETIDALPEDLRSTIGRLMPFADQALGDPIRSVPYQIQDYLELVDWSGRAIIEGKRGKIPGSLPPILVRLKIDPDNYIRFINRTQKKPFPWTHRQREVDAGPRFGLRPSFPEGPSRSRGAIQSRLDAPPTPEFPK